MSTPPNKLDEYRSHSHHHILMAANCTEIVRKMTDSTVSIQNLKSAKIGDEIAVSGAGEGEKLVMVINPLIESEFVIDGLDYTANISGIGSVHVIRDLKMVIREPRGIRFMNELENIYRKLQARGSGCHYVLKTIFVGHTYSGETKTISESNPLLLNLTNLKARFDHTGGIYDALFFGSQNGYPSQSVQLGVVNNNFMPSCDDGLLTSMIKDLESQINNQLMIEWEKAGNTTSAFKNKLVQYEFTYPESWEPFKLDTIHNSLHTEKDFKAKKGNTHDPESSVEKKGIGKYTVSFGLKTPLLSLLDKIFSVCPDIQKHTVSNSKGGIGGLFRLHKISTGVTSDAKTATVHVDIIEYFLAAPPPDDKVDENRELSGIVFDYIFSGKNTDITKFDMQMEDAIVFLNAGQGGRRPMDTNKSMDATLPTKGVKENKHDDIAISEIGGTSFMHDYQTAAERPVAFHSSSVGADSNQQTRQKYLEMLGKVNSKSIINTTMTIRGNPALFNQLIEPILPHGGYAGAMGSLHTKAEEISGKLQSGSTGVTAKSLDVETVQLGGDMSNHVPLFVKVNVFTPTPSDDHSSESANQPMELYSYWYKVLEIKNTFNNGIFSQTLKMAAHMVADPKLEA